MPPVFFNPIKGRLPWKSTCVPFAIMYTTPPSATLMEEFPRELLLKTFPTIGAVPNAECRRICSSQRSKGEEGKGGRKASFYCRAFMKFDAAEIKSSRDREDDSRVRVASSARATARASPTAGTSSRRARFPSTVIPS